MTREPTIVERLRVHRHAEIGGRLMGEAAEEIERLREALKEIEWSNDTKWQADRARRALEPKP